MVAVVPEIVIVHTKLSEVVDDAAIGPSGATDSDDDISGGVDVVGATPCVVLLAAGNAELLEDTLGGFGALEGVGGTVGGRGVRNEELRMVALAGPWV